MQSLRQFLCEPPNDSAPFCKNEPDENIPPGKGEGGIAPALRVAMTVSLIANSIVTAQVVFRRGDFQLIFLDT